MNATPYESLLLPLLVLVFSWNNSSLTTGSLAGSELLSYRRAVYLSITGFVAGTVIEGSKMSSVAMKISSPVEGTTAIAVIVSIALVALLSLGKVPASITHTIVGGLVGVSIAAGAPIQGRYLLSVLFGWAIAPTLAVFLTILLYRAMTSVVQGTSLLMVDMVNRIGVVIMVLYLTYSLGANNIGLINGLASNANLPLILSFNLVMLCLGVILFGKRIAQNVGTRLVGLSPLAVLAAMFCTATLLWAFTQLGIPIAVTQVAMGALIGANLPREPLMVNKRSLVWILGSWVLVTLLSVMLGYVLGMVFL